MTIPVEWDVQDQFNQIQITLQDCLIAVAQLSIISLGNDSTLSTPSLHFSSPEPKVHR